MKPLRFCMITTFYPPYNFGGDGIFVRQLSNELAQRGHWVDVIHSIDAYRLREKPPANGYDDHPNVTVHGLKHPLGFLSTLITQQSGYPLLHSRKIERILRKGFDVIHYHNISLVGGPRILEYGSAVKLYTMHEYWLVCPTHLLFKYNRQVCSRPNCFTCQLTYKRPPQWWRHSGLLQRALSQVDAFIAPSAFVQDVHHEKGLDIPIVHLPNFVPASRFGMDNNPPPSSPTPLRKPYFLFVGRLETPKGPQTLIPVFRRYDGADLLIAGTGSLEPQLRQLAGEAANIQFLGHQSEESLGSLYRGARAVILPSTCHEVFSLVIVEAFQQKTPVIARNLGGMTENIQTSGGGYVYDNDDELVMAMNRLLSDADERDRLGLLGYQAFQNKWTADVHLKRYFALIEAMSAKRGRPLSERALCSE